MRTRPRLLALALPAAAALAAPAPTGAQIIKQDVLVVHTLPDGTQNPRAAHTEGNSSSDLHPILAELQGPRYRGFAAAGVFGEVGISVGILAARDADFHTLTGQVEIGAHPAFVNTFGFPIHVFSDFVIDGGELFVIGDPGSYAKYDIRLAAHGSLRFLSIGTLEVTPSGDRVFTQLEDDIGATFDGDDRVEIPLSFQSADLGILQPGEPLGMTYDLVLEIGTGPQGEVVSADFSDPFHLSGHGVFGTLRFVPAGPAVVPEPATLALVAPGALVLLARRRRSRRG
jgi:hypothetical protein